MRLILELGSGAAPQLLPDARVIHLDCIEGPHVEIVADLRYGIPLPANVFDEVLALDVIEHLPDVVAIMNEMHRVLKPEGRAEIRVPQWGTRNHYTDPTHHRGFVAESFDYFDDATALGAHNGQIYTSRRWRLQARQQVADNFEFELYAIKPGEQARVLPELFGTL